METRLGHVGIAAHDGAEKLAKTVRIAYRKACEDFAKIVDNACLNRFVEDNIGTMDLMPDGTVKPRSLEMATASEGSEAVVNSYIAGACFVPCQSADSAMTAGFWRFARAA